jgi:hypothetical protein
MDCWPDPAQEMVKRASAGLKSCDLGEDDLLMQKGAEERECLRECEWVFILVFLLGVLISGWRDIKLWELEPPPLGEELNDLHRSLRKEVGFAHIKEEIEALRAIVERCHVTCSLLMLFVSDVG